MPSATVSNFKVFLIKPAEDYDYVAEIISKIRSPMKWGSETFEAK